MNKSSRKQDRSTAALGERPGDSAPLSRFLQANADQDDGWTIASSDDRETTEDHCERPRNLSVLKQLKRFLSDEAEPNNAFLSETNGFDSNNYRVDYPYYDGDPDPLERQVKETRLPNASNTAAPTIVELKEQDAPKVSVRRCEYSYNEELTLTNNSVTYAQSEREQYELKRAEGFPNEISDPKKSDDDVNETTASETPRAETEEISNAASETETCAEENAEENVEENAEEDPAFADGATQINEQTNANEEAQNVEDQDVENVSIVEIEERASEEISKAVSEIDVQNAPIEENAPIAEDKNETSVEEETPTEETPGENDGVSNDLEAAKAAEEQNAETTINDETTLEETEANAVDSSTYVVDFGELAEAAFKRLEQGIASPDEPIVAATPKAKKRSAPKREKRELPTRESVEETRSEEIAAAQYVDSKEVVEELAAVNVFRGEDAVQERLQENTNAVPSDPQLDRTSVPNASSSHVLENAVVRRNRDAVSRLTIFQRFVKLVAKRSEESEPNQTVNQEIARSVDSNARGGLDAYVSFSASCAPAQTDVPTTIGDYGESVVIAAAPCFTPESALCSCNWSRSF